MDAAITILEKARDELKKRAWESLIDLNDIEEVIGKQIIGKKENTPKNR